MSRFHPSMSWNESQQTSPADNPGGCDESLHGDGSNAEGSFLDGFSVGESDREFSDGTITPGPAARGHFGHRNYFLPLHYEPNYRYPLIVWLHSDGYNENQVDHVVPHISVRNYVAAGVRGIRAADSVGHRFDWHDSPAAAGAAHDAVCEAVDEATEQFSIHPDRIVLAGYGSGGTMALRIALRDPERFAAVVSMGGAMPVGQGVLRDMAQLRRRQLPMLWQWGVQGPHFDRERMTGDIRLAMMIKASVEVRQYPTEDEMDTVALRDVNDWIMRRVVSNDTAQSEQRWASSPTTYSAN